MAKTKALKQVMYTDGTPSREVEEEDLLQNPWNTSYSEDSKPEYTLLQCRDYLGEIITLLEVCREALLNSEDKEIKIKVGDVIYFQVEKQLNELQDRLAEL